MIRRIARFFIPKKVRAKAKFEASLLKSAFSDYWRYRKYAGMMTHNAGTHENVCAKLIMEAHKIEKGFSLPHPRLGFGVAAIQRLIECLKQYKFQGYDSSEMAFRKAQSVLAEYLRFHEKMEYDLGDRGREIAEWADMSCDIGGYCEFSAEDLKGNARGCFEECVLSRASVRSYDSKEVPDEVIRDAVRLARKTPSVCNRQAWHTYIVKSKELKERILRLQGGSRGFGDSAGFVAIVTTDIQSFVGPYERNQSYVDGGLYAMSLMYAFHFKGLGVCPLHWMFAPEISSELRELLGMKPSENIIMFMTVGNLPETVRVAKSVRKDVDSIVTFVDAESCCVQSP